MRKFNEDNERIKRRYLQYLKAAKCKDASTVLKVAEGILRFETSAGFASFKRFRIEQAIKFQERLNEEVSKTTGQPLSKSSIRSILAVNKDLFFWLAGESGYKSRIRHSHAFSYMPEVTDIDRRNKALFAFLMLTGARDGAVASLRLKHINMFDECVYQDAREVKTKASKSITTYFLPIDTDYLTCLKAWVAYLKEGALFGPDDPLFPPLKIKPVEGEFQVVGFERHIYKNANAIRAVIKEAFRRSDLPPFTPHAFRKTLVKWADTTYPTREAFKAFSQNIGHSSEVTTISAFCPVSIERQGELIKSPRIA
jgi:integrase